MPTSPIATLLNELVRKKLVSAREVAEVTGRGESTVYRWLNGHSEPSFAEVLQLVHHAASPHARRALVDLFTRDLPVAVEWINDDQSMAEDATHKQRLDGVDLAVLAMACVVRVLTNQREALREGELTEADKRETAELIDTSVGYLRACRKTVLNHPTRQKARESPNPHPR